MPTITHTDNVYQVAAAGLNVVPGIWVRLLNNSTSTNYFSTAVTDAQGAFTHSAPPGDYSLYTGNAATVPGTPTLRNAHYSVPVTAGDDAALGSVTALSSSPYAPNLPGAPSIATPAGVTAGKLWDFGGESWHVGAFGAKGDGVTDDTTALVNATTNAGAIVQWGNGTYPYSTTLVPATAKTWRGAGQNATVLKWTGAISGFMAAVSPAAGQNCTAFAVKDLTLDAGTISGVVPLLLNSWQFGLISDVQIQNGATAGTAALRMEATAGTTSANNTVGNHIRNLKIQDFPVGIQFAGQLGGSTNNFVTNNRFYGIYLDNISGIGIRAVQWCDSNAFFGTEIALGANNATGVLLNDSATPGSDVGVYNLNFYHLSIDSFNITGATGLLMNVTKQFMVSGFYHSPVAFNGTLINDNSGRALSYWILLTQDNASTNNTVLITKGFVMDTGSGSGGANNYKNWITQTVTTTGNSPVLSSVGADANIDLQVKGQGTGVVLVGTNFAQWIQLVGGATNVQVQAAGGGTNIDLQLVPKGTGLVDLRYATTALGGGAAPTVGTIGGSGPATAAQNSWLKVNINGTASFIPVWR